MSDPREALVALIPPPRAPEHVAHWPRDERDYYRHGDFADWSERLEVLDRMRREKVADAILAAGWTPPTAKPSLEQVVDALAAQPPGNAEWTSSGIMQAARAVLALFEKGDDRG